MKEIKSILKLFNHSGAFSEKSAIAQVVRVEESSYRREGARMLVFESGTFEGGISGGCLEGDHDRTLRQVSRDFRDRNN